MTSSPRLTVRQRGLVLLHALGLGSLVLSVAALVLRLTMPPASGSDSGHGAAIAALAAPFVIGPYVAGVILVVCIAVAGLTAWYVGSSAWIMLLAADTAVVLGFALLAASAGLEVILTVAPLLALAALLLVLGEILALLVPRPQAAPR